MPAICNVCGGTFDGAGPGPKWPHDTIECSRTTPQILRARIDDLEEFVSRVARMAPTIDVPTGAYDDRPPSWATFEEMGMHGEKCGRCGAWCSVVRPGKTQCEVCCDDDLTALAIQAARLTNKT